MPMETFQRPVRQPARMAGAAAPPRLRPKGPVVAAAAAAEARPRQSAVERLEADKAKYVKSQVALSKQQPVQAPDVRRRLVSPGANLRPTRKTPTQTKPKQEGVQLNLEHLSNLISGVSDGPQSSVTTASSEDSGAPDGSATDHRSASPTHEKKDMPSPVPCPDWSSPAKVRLKASGPVENPGSPGSQAAAVTVRRVDVMPQAGPVRTPCRRPQLLRQPLQPIPLYPQFPLRPAASHLRLFHLRTAPGSSPLKPVVGPVKPDNPPSSPPGSPLPAPPPPSLPVFPPPSPAITRLSSSSSRKRPSLTRSKSDMSDRFSRAGTELERFFNLCGLDPADLQEFTGSSSDIVSLARFRSVSAPGSEVAGSGREDEGNDDEEEEQEVPNAAEPRVPYGVSVIERNARVIKWLYGLRQAKDNAARSTNLLVLSCPFGILSYLLLWFQPHGSMSESGSVLWFFTVSCLFETLMSCYNVPYLSLNMFLGGDQRDRDSATAYRITVELVAMVLASVIQGQAVAAYNREKQEVCVNQTQETAQSASSPQTAALQETVET
ncbi:hypothetical protein INR49_003504, partial [Caranx melampygus]